MLETGSDSQFIGKTQHEPWWSISPILGYHAICRKVSSVRRCLVYRWPLPLVLVPSKIARNFVRKFSGDDVYSCRGYINKQCMDLCNNWVPQKRHVFLGLSISIEDLGGPPCGFQTSVVWYTIYTLPKTSISPEDWLEDDFFFGGWPIFRTHIVRDHVKYIYSP